ncbi:unnamed protein product [Rangifer tarandus platyrhynchus]|uniref:Uncharacterized protein n=1 Tax=Rangifer tarandus platyrhynchus TaxID=3082113 RepID=A0ACB1KG23_RANTA
MYSAWRTHECIVWFLSYAQEEMNTAAFLVWVLRPFSSVRDLNFALYMVHWCDLQAVDIRGPRHGTQLCQIVSLRLHPVWFHADRNDILGDSQRDGRRS